MKHMQEDTKQNTKSFKNKKLFTNETTLQQSKSVKNWSDDLDG